MSTSLSPSLSSPFRRRVTLPHPYPHTYFGPLGCGVDSGLTSREGLPTPVQSRWVEIVYEGKGVGTRGTPPEPSGIGSSAGPSDRRVNGTFVVTQETPVLSLVGKSGPVTFRVRLRVQPRHGPGGVHSVRSRGPDTGFTVTVTTVSPTPVVTPP